MTELFDIKNIKGKIFFTIIGVVLVLVLFVFGYMMPMRTKTIKLEESLADLDRQRIDSARKVEDLVILKNNLPALLRDQFTIDRLIPNEPNHSRIVEFVHYLAELHALDVEVADFIDEQPLPLAKVADDKKSDAEKKLDNKLIRTLRRFPATIRIGGKFSDVVSFIRDFKWSNRYFEIYSITIPEEETARAMPDTYPISMEGYFYFYAPDEESSGSAAQQKTEFEKLIEAEGLGDKYLTDQTSEAESANSQNGAAGSAPSLEDLAAEQADKPTNENPDENGEGGEEAVESGNIEGSKIQGSDIIAGNYGGFKPGVFAGRESLPFIETWIGKFFNSALSAREVA